MPSRKDLRDDEILRWQRFSVTESAAATFTESEYNTNLSIEIGLIWLIHFLELELLLSNVDDPAQNAYEYLACQITRESKTALINLNDADLIARGYIEKDRYATIGTEAGPFAHSAISPVQFHFNPPIPYASREIYVGVLSSSGSAQNVKGRIGYTVRRVTEKFFLRVAHALISG